MGDLFANLIPLFLLVLGYIVGKVAEWRHYRSIREREKNFQQIPVLTAKTLDDPRPIQYATLAMGSVVVSVDYYKRFMASFRKIFGGEMLSYSSLIDRGRREALLRMKESRAHADLFLNCRLETASIFKGRGKSTGSVEVIAYSTAVKFQK
jgi:uncharacterized protein YbjQ (UPF0145 family)